MTYTVIRVGPSNFSQETPYVVAIVEVNDGVRMTMQVADIDVNKVEIGQNIRIIFRRIQDEGKSGLHCYGYKAVVI